MRLYEFCKHFLTEYININNDKLADRLKKDNSAENLSVTDEKSLIAFFELVDPSPRNKYVNWMINKYMSGTVRQLEDFDARVKQYLVVYMDLQNKKKLQPEH